MDTWVRRTAREIAEAVRAGTVTPQEVAGQHLDQIDRLDGRVGAFVRVRHERALAEAEQVAARSDLTTLPLAGVPVAVKDNIQVAGEPTRYGATVTPDQLAPHDHEVVRRLRAAGAVVIGISRLPELGVWATSEDAAGVARNPWNLDRTPGGSSGGSAAAVAAGMVPAAHGNDGLGSIRIPASCCGLVGIKPGAGVVPSGVGLTSWRGLAENGPLTTTVEDTALLLSVMAGRPELADVATPAPGLRIAASTLVPLPGVRVDPEILNAVIGAAAALRHAGHDVTRADPPYSQATASALIAWYTASTADETAALDEPRLEPRQRRHAQIGRAALRLGRVRESDRDRWKEQVARFFSGYDLLLTPVMTAMPPAAAGWRDRSWWSNFWGNARWAPFPGAWNFAQYPAATVPVAVHSNGMPIGLQLVAPPGGEALLLSVAGQLQSLRPWRRHAPLAGLD
jgi:amidase